MQINYDLWSYSDIKDENEHFLNVVTPAIENAKFVLFFVANDSSKDFLVAGTYRLCSNLNKRVIPIKIGNGNVKGFEFRSDVLDYDKEGDRKALIEQVHGLLGLRKIGDIYGASVTLTADLPCEVSRDGEIIGNITPDKNLKCILAKGTGSLKFKTEDGWNSYRYDILDEDNNVEFHASFRGLQYFNELKYATNISIVKKGLPQQWRWDATNRTDFIYESSSADDKKRKFIINSFNKYYLSRRQHYSEITKRQKTRAILCLVIFLIIYSPIISDKCFGTVFLESLFDLMYDIMPDAIATVSIILLLLFPAAVLIYLRCTKRKIPVSGRDVIDNYNVQLWKELNDKMNETLTECNFETANLENLGTP